MTNKFIGYINMLRTHIFKKEQKYHFGKSHKILGQSQYFADHQKCFNSQESLPETFTKSGRVQNYTSLFLSVCKLSNRRNKFILEKMLERHFSDILERSPEFLRKSFKDFCTASNYH